MNWRKTLGIKRNQPLKNKTSFRIGGRAAFFSSPSSLSQLRGIVIWAAKKKIPILMIGAGTNLLISDKGIKGLVIRLSAPCFKEVHQRLSLIEAGSGITLSSLIRLAGKMSLSGLEFLSGVPGTLGGALAMNAGCWGKEISNLVEEIEVMDYKGEVRRISREDVGFKYRESGLGNYIILKARLKLKKGKLETINKRIKDFILKKRKSQDMRFYNAGCIFKNTKLAPAGKLIDMCGLKGLSLGDAFISDKHANFILNRGDAKSSDVLKLIRLMRRSVKKKFGLILSPEIKIAGEKYV
ncbi:MAG: UDP-N-acetylmuramate dehydrogenase [Candidatus Omnitrophica bacterium]|nr:UDP-N-acetylmuramate dehydrogenase [Candidatus Omnitrophota bacterium]